MVDGSEEARDAQDGAGAQGLPATGSFGPNAWLVDDMYDQFQADPTTNHQRIDP